MTLKQTLMKICFLLSPVKSIILESSPDYSDNSRAVFDELIKRGINKKYRVVWLCYDKEPEKCPKIKNVFAINEIGIKRRWYNLIAKAIISCNRFQVSTREDCFSMYLDHGHPFKHAAKYQKAPPELSCYLSSSVQTVSARKDIFGFSEKTEIVSLGFPRNDVFSEKPTDLNPVFHTSGAKFIAWYPTFRNHKDKNRNEGGDPIPIIHDEDKAIQLNEAAKELNVFFVVKPHPIQDIQRIKDFSLSNILFIDDEFLHDNNIISYRFLNACDALLSDYSSVFIDFLLADKPIGLIWEDIEQYKQDLGLVDNYQFLSSGCEKIYTIDDLISFTKDVAEGKDELADERRKVRDYSHYSTDGKNAERVADYIIKTIFD